MDSKLIGKWETDDQGYKFDVVYRRDHTFEASGHSKGLSMVICTGTWHLEDSCIVQDIKTHAETYGEGTQRRWNITKLTRHTLAIGRRQRWLSSVSLGVIGTRYAKATIT
jgi:hypothetical protein